MYKDLFCGLRNRGYRQRWSRYEAGDVEKEWHRLTSDNHLGGLLLMLNTQGEIMFGTLCSFNPSADIRMNSANHFLAYVDKYAVQS